MFLSILFCNTHNHQFWNVVKYYLRKTSVGASRGLWKQRGFYFSPCCQFVLICSVTFAFHWSWMGAWYIDITTVWHFIVFSLTFAMPKRATKMFNVLMNHQIRGHPWNNVSQLSVDCTPKRDLNKCHQGLSEEFLNYNKIFDYKFSNWHNEMSHLRIKLTIEEEFAKVRPK